MRPLDLTGHRFGQLVVLREHPVPYRSPSGKPTRRWVCRCDCGNEVIVRQNALTAKTKATRSCGCLQAKATRARAIDLTGRTFGRLTILRPVELDKPGKQRLGWVARCACGREIVITYRALLNGVQSCGCLLRDSARRKMEDNTIQRYDGTTVSAIRPTRKPNRNNQSGYKGVYWSSREQRWIAKIGVRGKSITLGRFARLEDAAAARAEAEAAYYAPIIAAFDAQCKIWNKFLKKNVGK